MKNIIILFFVFSQVASGQVIDYISHKKVNIVATYSMEVEREEILNIAGTKESSKLTSGATFGIFAYNQELGDSLFLFLDKKPKFKISIKEFTWVISNEGAWNLILETNDPKISRVTFIIYDQVHWTWEKELEIWEAPVEISIVYEGIPQINDRNHTLTKINSFDYKGGEFKIPDNVYSDLINIKNLAKKDQVLKDVGIKYDLSNKYLESGLLKVDQKDIKGAIEDFNISIKNNPDNSKIYLSRGKAKGQLQKYGEALADFRKAVELDTSLVEGYYQCGNTEYVLGLDKESLNDYNKAIQLDPRHCEAYIGKGLVNTRLNDYNRALRDFNYAIQINPNYSDAYIFRGVVKSSLKEYRDAIKDFDIGIKLNPDYDKAYLYRGMAKLDLMDDKSALSDFNKTIEINPKNAQAQFLRGTIHYKFGDIVNACLDWNLAYKNGFQEAQKLILKYCK